jgi:hypothetical protein
MFMVRMAAKLSYQSVHNSLGGFWQDDKHGPDGHEADVLHVIQAPMKLLLFHMVQ